MRVLHSPVRTGFSVLFRHFVLKMRQKAALPLRDFFAVCTNSNEIFVYLTIFRAEFCRRRNKSPWSFDHEDLYGGDGEIWTLAPISRPTPLAGEPLHQLGYVSMSSYAVFVVSLPVSIKIIGGTGGIHFLRKIHGGCNMPPAYCQEPPFESQTHPVP